MVNLQVKRTVKLPINKSILLRAAQVTLEMENVTKGSELSIIIGDDALLNKLNLKYRQVDASTDVLSFPSNELDPDTKSVYWGDVIISLPRAQQQAAAGGHALADELQLLVVHGTLHLLGYDHMHRVDKKRMQAAQANILSQLGVELAHTL
jgi:probable rRNA maturation factor